MGIKDTLARLADAPRLIQAHNDRLGIANPFAPPHNLAEVDLPDYVDGIDLGVTHTEALRVPAVRRARGLICGTIARLPMQVHDANGPRAVQPPWLDRTSGPLAPWKRTALLTEDMLFHGWALASVERGVDGWPLRIGYIPWKRWSFDGDGNVLVDDRRAPDGAVALFPGPDEGVLKSGADAIRAALDLSRTAGRAAKTPIPNIELHDTGQRPLTDAQIDKLVSDWVRARQGRNGGVAYTNSSIELRAHGSQNADLLVKEREAAAVDIARVMGVPASMLDATTANASRGYENMSGRNAEFVDYGLSPLMAALCARLGMDDICPAGQHVEIDLEGFTSLRPADAAVPDDGANPAPPAPDNRNLRSV